MGEKNNKLAKAGEEMSAKAMSELKKRYPRMFARGFDTKESIVIKAKSDAKRGSWMCADCGKMFQNNLYAFAHPKSHRLVWWTGEQFEEA